MATTAHSKNTDADTRPTDRISASAAKPARSSLKQVGHVQVVLMRQFTPQHQISKPSDRFLFSPAAGSWYSFIYQLRYPGMDGCLFGLVKGTGVGEVVGVWSLGLSGGRNINIKGRAFI